MQTGYWENTGSAVNRDRGWGCLGPSSGSEQSFEDSTSPSMDLDSAEDETVDKRQTVVGEPWQNRSRGGGGKRK